MAGRVLRVSTTSILRKLVPEFKAIQSLLLQFLDDKNYDGKIYSLDGTNVYLFNLVAS